MARSSGQVSYGAGSVQKVIVMTVVFLFLANGVVHAHQSKTYRVGGYDIGWDVIIPQQSWADSKTFYAGDKLEFKYDDIRSNLVVVNKYGHDHCIANKGSKEYNSGFDTIQLPYGMSYYIGTYNPEDCSAGEKMAINALAPPPN